MKIKLIALLFVAGIYSSPILAFSGSKADSVNEIDAEQAKSCKFLKSISAYKMGMGADGPMQKAKEETKKKASDLGGNSIVVKSIQSQGAFMMVVVDAYICSVPSATPPTPADSQPIP